MRFGSSQLAPEFNPFEDDYIGEILAAVAQAWARMRKKDEIEDRITFRLAGRLQNDPLFRDIPYDIVPQHWLLDINGRRLGRLDLRFKHRQSQRDYFAFESKRLHVRYPGGSVHPEYSIYSGGEGMGAFIEGQYSKDLPAAGMLGYVMDGDTSKAWHGIDKSIASKHEELRLTSNGALMKSAMLSFIQGAAPGTELGETLHDLISHHLRLFHMLLP